MSRLLNLVQKLLNLETDHGDRELQRARAGEQAKKKKTAKHKAKNILIYIYIAHNWRSTLTVLLELTIRQYGSKAARQQKPAIRHANNQKPCVVSSIRSTFLLLFFSRSTGYL